MCDAHTSLEMKIMFTGIIEERGVVSRIERSGNSIRITINAGKILDDCKNGDSIAINGVCLTVTRVLGDGFILDAVAETMRRTNLGELRIGDKINLERSLRPVDRMGGHIVAGHVDGVGKITGLAQEGISTIMTVEVPGDLMKYIAVKGSVCIDGTSLTVTNVSETGFQVSLIPYTKEITTLGLKGTGDRVNIEVDMLARYVERLLECPMSFSGSESGLKINEDFLRIHGFV